MKQPQAPIIKVTGYAQNNSQSTICDNNKYAKVYKNVKFITQSTKSEHGNRVHEMNYFF